jgi:hypothetical protein
MNDLRVIKWLGEPPYPYETRHALDWLQSSTKKAYDIFRGIEADPEAFSAGCPFKIVREVTEDGRDIYIGDCSIVRWSYDEVLDPEVRNRMKRENEERIAGDSKIEWSFGGDMSWIYLST